MPPSRSTACATPSTSRSATSDALRAALTSREGRGASAPALRRARETAAVCGGRAGRLRGRLQSARTGATRRTRRLRHARVCDTPGLHVDYGGSTFRCASRCAPDHCQGSAQTAPFRGEIRGGGCRDLGRGQQNTQPTPPHRGPVMCGGRLPRVVRLRADSRTVVRPFDGLRERILGSATGARRRSAKAQTAPSRVQCPRITRSGQV